MFLQGKTKVKKTWNHARVLRSKNKTIISSIIQLSFRPHSPTRVHFNEENNQYFSRPNSIYVDQINLSTIPNSDEPDVVRTHSDQQQPQDAFENIAYIDDSSSSAENLDRASWHWCDVKLLSEIDVLDFYHFSQTSSKSFNL